MKSYKKRFKILLTDIEGSAMKLQLISSELALLKDIFELAERVLSCCNHLKQRLNDYDKLEFAEKIMGDEALMDLDECADLDVISALEQRFSSALVNTTESQLDTFFKQLLEKLEKHHALLIENIQKLSTLPENH